MSDVFISYAREDRAIAQALASDLQTRGYRVWWDAELVAADDFQEVILAALSKAGAVIVVWTKNSVKSHFVRDEARFALHYKKLAAVKAPGLEVLEIPFGFQGQHTDDLDNREQIVRAISKLGVSPATTGAGAGNASWESVSTTRDVDTLLDWLERNPGHEKREAAFARVRQLVDSTEAGAKQEPARLLRMSNLSAFLSGLTFRMPKFQLATQGKWTSIGFSIGLALLLSAAAAAALWGTLQLEKALRGAGWARADHERVTAPTFLMLLSFITWIAKNRFDVWIKQRSFTAAGIVAPFFALLAGGLSGMLLLTSALFLDSSRQPGAWIAGSVLLAVFAFGIAAALIYMFAKYRSAR